MTVFVVVLRGRVDGRRRVGVRRRQCPRRTPAGRERRRVGRACRRPSARHRRHARTSGGTPLDVAEAVDRAETYLAQTGYTGTASVHGNEVFVEVTITRHLVRARTRRPHGRDGPRPRRRAQQSAPCDSSGTDVTASLARRDRDRGRRRARDRSSSSPLGTPIALWKLAGWPLPVVAADAARHRATACPEIRSRTRPCSRRSRSSDGSHGSRSPPRSLVETVAWTRGRAAPRLRFAGAAQPLDVQAPLLRGVPSRQHPPSNGRAGRPTTRPPCRIHPHPAAVETPTTFLTHADAHRVHPSLLCGDTAKSYTVVRYDTLWRIAETHLGDPLRWRELFALNRGIRQPDGRALEDPQLIMPGWMLTLPADATGSPPAPCAQPAAARHPTIRRRATPERPTRSRHVRPPDPVHRTRRLGRHPRP